MLAWSDQVRNAVLFVYKRDGQALVLSARDMATKERRQYGRK